MGAVGRTLITSLIIAVVAGTAVVAAGGGNARSRADEAMIQTPVAVAPGHALRAERPTPPATIRPRMFRENRTNRDAKSAGAKPERAAPTTTAPTTAAPPTAATLATPTTTAAAIAPPTSTTVSLSGMPPSPVPLDAEASPPTAPAPAPLPDPMPSWHDAPPVDPTTCRPAGRGVVVDRRWQRAWLCQGGAVLGVVPVTTAIDQPDPGVYSVYAMDDRSSSVVFDRLATLDRFIAFTRGKYEGLRIGFHAVPYFDDGRLLQPIDSVGTLLRAGDSSGCIRVRPEHAEWLYAFLQVGDEIRVIT